MTTDLSSLHDKSAAELSKIIRDGLLSFAEKDQKLAVMALGFLARKDVRAAGELWKLAIETLDTPELMKSAIMEIDSIANKDPVVAIALWQWAFDKPGFADYREHLVDRLTWFMAFREDKKAIAPALLPLYDKALAWNPLYAARSLSSLMEVSAELGYPRLAGVIARNRGRFPDEAVSCLRPLFSYRPEEAAAHFKPFCSNIQLSRFAAYQLGRIVAGHQQREDWWRLTDSFVALLMLKDRAKPNGPHLTASYHDHLVETGRAFHALAKADSAMARKVLDPIPSGRFYALVSDMQKVKDGQEPGFLEALKILGFKTTADLEKFKPRQDSGAKIKADRPPATPPSRAQAAARLWYETQVWGPKA